MVRVGMVGNGIITKEHRAAYAELKKDGVEIEIVAVSDIRPECTAACEGERVYGDYKELLKAEQGKLDFLDICLPTYMHAEASIMAMEMGYHVMCEKPMALNYEDALSMCEAAKRTGKTLMIAQSARFAAIGDVVREYIKSGEFGKPVTAQIMKSGGNPTGRWKDWMYDKDLCGGGILDFHLHSVDFLNSVFGMPEAVTAGAVNRIPGSGYDLASATYHYPDGFFATATGGWGTSHLKYGNSGQTFIFEKGYIYFGTSHGQSAFVAVDEAGNVKDLKDPATKGTKYREIKYFMDCILEGKPVDFCSPESTANSIKIIMAECESADKHGELIKL